MATSPDTVLRKLKAGPSVEVRGARALGVDDWAWRKGQSYGTILVDLESHAPIDPPIDLLPDRPADSPASWLQAHPGEEVTSRDRGGIYADGATPWGPSRHSSGRPFPFTVQSDLRRRTGPGAEARRLGERNCDRDAGTDTATSRQFAEDQEQGRARS